MSWRDYGFIFKVKHLSDWAVSHAYVPTAVSLLDRIRVFVSFWDLKSHGRLGYIDVDPIQPTKVLGWSEAPVVEDSIFPAFDASGVTPLSILSEAGFLRLYYAGWRRHSDPEIRYELLTGLLLGDAQAESFRRYSEGPLLEPRTPSEHIRTGGQVLKTREGYRCYLATQAGVHKDVGKVLPVYNLECAFSKDGICWDDAQRPIFKYEPKKILGFGRSAIWQNKNGTYEGLFSVRGWHGAYTDLLYSSSVDGITWEDLHSGGKAFLASMTCDQQAEVCFPSVIFQNDRILMFYNGNSFGREGLRLAIWQDP